MLVPLLRLLTAGAAVIAQTNAVSTTVSLPNGATITGTVETKPTGNLVNVFRGIPYAEPPIGARRWKPSTLKPPSGNMTATTYGGTCIGMGTSPQSTEDCLFLNIFAPAGATKDSKFPVMVWIHGGALLNGASNTYDAHSIVNAGGKKVVVVNLNYRLGVFGFLSSKEILAEGNGANFGLRDQETAFQWVKQYIQHFGGNPNDITAFGESAGAWSVGHHMISREGDQKLFQRAILQSGAFSTVHDTPLPSVQQDKIKTIANAVGCGGNANLLGCLRRASTSSIASVTGSNWRGFPWMPTVDGVFLKDTAVRRLRAGKVSRIPTIIGTTTDEGWLFTSWVTQESQFNSFLRSQFSMLTEAEYTQVAALYPSSSFPSLRHRTGEIYGDAIFVCPTELLSETLVNDKTFRYRFTHTTTDSGYQLAIHGNDVVYTFNQVGDIADSNVAGKAVASHIQSFWTNFARTGSPNGATPAVTWPQYSLATKPEILIQQTLAVDTVGSYRPRHAERCAFWRSVENRIADSVAFK